MANNVGRPFSGVPGLKSMQSRMARGFSGGGTVPAGGGVMEQTVSPGVAGSGNVILTPGINPAGGDAGSTTPLPRTPPAVTTPGSLFGPFVVGIILYVILRKV